MSLFTLPINYPYTYKDKKPLIWLSPLKSLTRRQLNVFQPIQLTENNSFRYRYRCPDIKLIYRFQNDAILFHVTEPYHMTLTLVKESVKAIRHLVSGGANPNSQNSHGLTPSDLVNSNKYINQETQKRNKPSKSAVPGPGIKRAREL